MTHAVKFHLYYILLKSYFIATIFYCSHISLVHLYFIFIQSYFMAIYFTLIIFHCSIFYCSPVLVFSTKHILRDFFSLWACSLLYKDLNTFYYLFTLYLYLRQQTIHSNRKFYCFKNLVCFKETEEKKERLSWECIYNRYIFHLSILLYSLSRLCWHYI